jgi:DeoR/GlpR family transcriptional regulator of sugar metabolism
MINSTARDLGAVRLGKVRDILRQQPVVRVAELQAALNVSSATARRDLARLVRMGEVKRVHGGAMLAGSRLDEPLFDNKEALAAGEKQRIARAALRLVTPHSCVFLDGGSTVLALARLLHERADVTIVTNSLRVAMDLSSRGPRLILIGGELRRLSQTFVGPLTRFTLETLHVDTAFIGTIGVTPNAGLTTTDPQEAFTKTAVMQHARQVVLLADSSKLGRISFARFGAAQDVDMLITDRRADRRTLGEFRKRKIKVLDV